MTANLFDGARFGDRFLTKNGHVALYQRRIKCPQSGGKIWNKHSDLHNLMTDDGIYTVDDDGKCINNGITFDSYTIVCRVMDDEDFIDAIAIKECPFDDSCFSGFYKTAFKNGFKKALNIRI